MSPLMKAKNPTNLYFLALIPDDQTAAEIMAMKQSVADNFKSKGALRSPPHITLHMPFKWRADREDQLLGKLSDFKFDDYPFEVELDGYDFFEPRVVFVRVVNNESLKQLHHEVTTFVRRSFNILNADYKARGFHPHITIGFRDLRKNLFPQVIAEYKDKSYNKSFSVSRICLLKHSGDHWKPFKYF